MVAAALLVVGGLGLEAFGRGDLRVGGLLENPNVAASLLVVSVPLVSSLRNGHRNRWLIVIGIVLVGGVLLTGSRAGLLAILAAGVALLPRGRARIVGSAIGFGAMTVVLVWRFVSHPEVLAWFRPAIWLAVVRLWAAHPVVGVGPGGLADAAGPVRLLHEDHVGQHQFLITYAESSPLGLLVQVGLAGLVIAAVAAGLWLRRGHRDGALAFGPLQSVVLGMAVMAAFHDFVTIDIVLWWWAVAFGMIEAAQRGSSPDHEQVLEPPWTGLIRGMVLSFVVLWGIVQPAWAKWLWKAEVDDLARVDRATAAEPWFSEPLEWRVQALLDEETWTWPTAAEAIARAGEATRIHPGASRLWMILGQVQYRVVSELGPWPDSVATARSAFARATELEPYQPWPWLEWARLERGLGNLDESAELARRALEAEPHAVRARLFLARVELDRGNMRLAREALESAAASTALRRRAGLTTYEKELLAAPMWQFRELGEALR